MLVDDKKINELKHLLERYKFVIPNIHNPALIKKMFQKLIDLLLDSIVNNETH